MNYQLVIFDLDGTLADRDSLELYPGVAKKLRELQDEGVYLSCATNQGGPACRDAGWKLKGGEYPSFNDTVRRVRTLANRAGIDFYGVFMCFLYVARDGRLMLPDYLKDHLLEVDEVQRRKPNPGMLIEAMVKWNVHAGDTLMVGDSEDDRKAAENAGVAFQWAHEFFGRAL